MLNLFRSQKQRAPMLSRPLRVVLLSALAGASVLVALLVIVFTVLHLSMRSAPVIDSATELLVLDTRVSAMQLTQLPDFEAYADVEERKEAFFAFLQDLIDDENRRIMLLRAEVMPLWDVVSREQPLSRIELERVQELAAEYRIDWEAHSVYQVLAELRLRIDAIPTSLVLAQAANESAWGTSRFAREGNNIFGQWCFDEGCGLVPERRAADATHEVRAFPSVEGSVRSYFRNLNTNSSYEYFRELRAEMREQGRPLDSMVLVRGLLHYSERGTAYIDELQDIIRVNRLSALDRS